MGLIRTVAPVNSAVDFDDAMKQVELPYGDTTHHRHLERDIAAATAIVEHHTRRALITQTWRLSINCFRDLIVLPRPPLQSISAITYRDTNGVTQTVNPDVYRVSTDAFPGYVERAYNQSWPSVRLAITEAVTITYVAGYGDDHFDVAPQLQHAIHELVAFSFVNRGDTEIDIPKHIRWMLKSLRCGAQYDYYGIKA